MKKKIVKTQDIGNFTAYHKAKIENRCLHIACKQKKWLNGK